MKALLDLTKYKMKKLLDLIITWQDTEFSSTFKNELDFLELLHEKEIVSKNKCTYKFNYSLEQLTNDIHTAFTFEERELLKLIIEEIEQKKIDTHSLLNTIVYSSISKNETKILLKLVELEIHKNKKGLNQQEILKAYNDQHFDELKHLDQSIKQSSLSRSLKNLKEQEFIIIIKFEKESLHFVNWGKFSV
jgi:hypothetical protein